MYSWADFRVSILVIFEASFAAGKCLRNLSSASLRWCILFLSLSLALTRLILLMIVLSPGKFFVNSTLVVDELLPELADWGPFAEFFLSVLSAVVRLSRDIEWADDDEVEVADGLAIDWLGDCANWNMVVVAHGELTLILGDGEQVVVATLALEFQQSAE